MLPQDVLSTEPYPAAFLPPRNRYKRPLEEFELGGVALNDGSEGLEVRIWRLRFVEGDFIIDTPGVDPVTLVSVADVVISCSLAFDQNMQPVIAWDTANGAARFYWFDPTIPGFTTDTLPAGSTSVRCSLDDHRELATESGTSDVILAYVRGSSLYYRQQRDRYDTEYLLSADVEGAMLDQVGMSVLRRFQFRLTGGLSTSGLVRYGDELDNADFEGGDTGWTWTGSGSGTIDEVGPTFDGTWSARAGFTSNPNSTQKTLTNDARPTVEPGTVVGLEARLQSPSESWGADEDAPWARIGIQWYDEAMAIIGTTYSALIYGYDALAEWVRPTARGVAPPGAAHWTSRADFAWGDGAFAIDSFRHWTETNGTSLESVIRSICGRAGVESIDASDHLENFIDGYTLTRETSARSALAPLRTVGMFDIVERGPTLRFPARGKAPVATLTVDDFGVHESGAEGPPGLSVVKAQDVELPRQVRLRYRSVARDYERGEQLSRVRHNTIAVNDVSTELSVAMSDAKASQIVDIVHREAWASRWNYQITLGPEWHRLEPADVLLVPDEGRLYRIRLTSISDAGLVIRSAEAVRDDDDAYTSIGLAPAGLRPPSSVVLLGGTALIFLDLPALREADDNAAFYVAAVRTGIGTDWPGARVFRSVDGETYDNIATVANQATIGTVVSAPADGDPHTWDNAREIVVDISQGTLESRTDAAVLAGANGAAIGADGRWHIFQFASAELIATGRYRLTRLLQGRRGTEHLIGTAQPGDTFVLVSGPGIIRPSLANNEIGAERIYRPVTNGAAFAAGVDQTFTGSGEALEPFSPVQAAGERDSTGDLTIGWTRRDRLADTLLDGAPVPMSEASEAYEVDILNGSTVVRTIGSLTSPAALYTAAQQTTDFGSAQAEVTVRIYQLSAVVGRGYPLEATL
jgi:hypothetical protein